MSPRPNTPGPAPEPGDAPSFEESLQQLEEIVERIERGEIGLERSIAEYERGVTLIKRCRDILERAEQRVEELTRQMEPPPGGPSRGGPADQAGFDDPDDEENP